MQEQALSECYTVIRNWIDIRFKIISFFGTISVSSFVFALREQSVSLILLSTIFLVMQLIADIMVRLNIVPYFVLGLRIEKKIGLEDGIAHLYMKMYSGNKYFSVLQDCYNGKDNQKIRYEFLKEFFRPFGFISSFVHSIIIFEIVVLIFASFVLTYVFKWNFFV